MLCTIVGITEPNNSHLETQTQIKNQLNKTIVQNHKTHAASHCWFANLRYEIANRVKKSNFFVRKSLVNTSSKMKIFENIFKSPKVFGCSFSENK